MSDRTRQKKNKRGYIENWDQTGSTEIPDRAETSEIPRPPFGVGVEGATRISHGKISQGTKKKKKVN